MGRLYLGCTETPSCLLSSIKKKIPAEGDRLLQVKSEWMKACMGRSIQTAARSTWCLISSEILKFLSTPPRNNKTTHGVFHLVQNNRAEHNRSKYLSNRIQQQQEPGRSKTGSSPRPVWASHGGDRLPRQHRLLWELSRPHSAFLHYRSDFSRAERSRPPSRAWGCEHMHSGIREVLARC